jgi:transaldolase
MKVEIELYSDGASLEQMAQHAGDNRVSGFTTNPTLMRAAGVQNYKDFALRALEVVSPRPISFEVFADDLTEMVIQARKIASWGTNIFVKIPITNTRGDSAREVIQTLNQEGIQVNVTAILTAEQVEHIAGVLQPQLPNIISIFGGRIADSGVDPIPVMQHAKRVLSGIPGSKLLWASPREVLNLIQAQEIGCDIITLTPELWKKIPLLGQDLHSYSLETVKMFHKDAEEAGFSID